MKNESISHGSSHLIALCDFFRDSHLTKEVNAKISEYIDNRKIIDFLLISASDNSVIELPNRLLLSVNKDEHTQVKVWHYLDWRRNEAVEMENDYDLTRFNRSTDLLTLCRKVCEHQQYSFIARTRKEGEALQVFKYTFVKLSDDGSSILASKQNITKSLEHDVLTGGLNRVGFLHELAVKFRNRPQGVDYTLLCFNIKNFRIINELHGNRVGDKVLQHVYTSIVYSELHPISYARYEADDFICLVDRASLNTDVIGRLCHQEMAVGTLRIPFRLNCGIFHLSEIPEEPVEACAHAMLAINFIKDQFTPWIVFEPHMRQDSISDTEVLSQIEEAISLQEIVPYYQPVVNLQTNRIEMAEALVRWKSHKHGMVSPGVFIPVLERNGGLSRIDTLMEKRVFELQKSRLEQGLPVVPIDLNLSWADFADTELVAQLQEHILDPSVSSDLLRFEITESSYEEIADNRLDVLSFFKEHNVKLLVDDFGQGYSFGTMKNVDFHIIKLDKSLIDKLGESRKMDLVVKTLINVFHSMDTKVVAEGVEHESQVKFLREAGCDYIQGFYFYRPMDEESFLELLENQHKENPVSVQVATAEVSEKEIESMNTPIVVDREVIVEQNQKLQVLQDEERCLRLLLDAQDIHLFEWDVKTHEDICSDKFAKLYGLPSNLIKDIPEVAPLALEEDRERFRSFYARIAKGEKMGTDSFRLYKPDGKGYTWYRKTFYTIFDKNGLPSKAIITMKDSENEYRYSMLRTRDRMLTQQQEIVTFIYTLCDDKLSITFRTPDGDVVTRVLSNLLDSPENSLPADQAILASNLRKIIEQGSRSGYFDFMYSLYNTEFRAHYSMVDGEYGHLYAIIGQAEDINKTRERITAREQMLRMAEIDGLTQIYNRMAGEQRIQKACREHQPGLFGILDCDKFKHVNDTFGHAVGDELLIAIARLITNGNPRGVNMRLGGDEFAFFISGEFTPEGVKEDFQHFFQELKELNIPGMEGWPISISIGAVIYDGKEDTDFDQIYRESDKLLYQSKKIEGSAITL